MPRRALSTLELTATLPAALFVLVVGVDLGGLGLERALLKGQLAQTCLQARAANEATPPAFSAPSMDLNRTLAGPEAEVLIWPEDPFLVCQAQRPVQGLIGMVVRPHTLRVRHRLPVQLPTGSVD